MLPPICTGIRSLTKLYALTVNDDKKCVAMSQQVFRNGLGYTPMKITGFICWCGLALTIIIGSLIPVQAVEQVPSILSDKVQHFIGYAVLSIAAVSAGRAWQQKGMMIFLSFLMGIAIEFIQPMTGRYFETGDIIANSVGLVAGVLIFFLSSSALDHWARKA